MEHISSAYLKLVEIENKCRAKAVGLPDKKKNIKLWTGIGFVMMNKAYVVSMEEVAEISPVPRCTRVPGAQGWVKGISNLRGRLLPILNLTSFLYHHDATQQLRRKRVLVVERGDLYCGLVIDSILGMEHFPEESYMSSVHEVDEVVKPYIIGSYKREDEMWPVFSPFCLMADNRFLSVSIGVNKESMER